MIRIGIDIQSVSGQVTGIGYYTQNLIKEYSSIPDADFCYYKSAKGDEPNTIDRMLWENIHLRSMAKRDKVDVLHVPGFAGPKSIGSIKKVTTVHDLIGMIYPQNLGLVSRFYWQRWLPACVKNSEHIIADSENTKKDIMRLLRIPEKAISVVYLAVDSRFKKIEKNNAQKEVLKKYKIDKKYILNVGTVEPRKNIINLIEAFRLFMQASDDTDMILVIAGKKGWDYQRCFSKAKDLDIAGSVIFCDYVSDEDMPILYNNAESFVYPSLYEGFGLPVLEALSCGIPVVCSNVSSLPEVAGNAALYIDPGSIESIKEMLLESVYSKETIRDLSAQALLQAEKFSWKTTAEQTMGIYRKVFNEA